MPDIEVHIDLNGEQKRVGLLRRNARRGAETTTFECAAGWLGDPAAFALEPALTLGRGVFAPGGARTIFGSIGDSAPDTWGKRLMQRRERHAAERERRPVRTLQEADYLLGVSDVLRLGALRFRLEGEDVFCATHNVGVPGIIDLGRLLGVTERVLRDEETDEDLQLILAPGSSLGGKGPRRPSSTSTTSFRSQNFPRIPTTTVSSSGSSSH